MSASAQRCFEGKLLGERTWVCKTIKRIPRASLAASWQQYPIKSRLLGWFLFWICSELRLLLASSCSLLTSALGINHRNVQVFHKFRCCSEKLLEKLLLELLGKRITTILVKKNDFSANGRKFSVNFIFVRRSAPVFPRKVCKFGWYLAMANPNAVQLETAYIDYSKLLVSFKISP